MLINRIGRTISFRNRKFNSVNLIFLFAMASFIGAFSATLPALLSGIGTDGESLDTRIGSNLGYEEIIKVNVDQYGNLTVIGSFQGPQTNPDIDDSLPEYEDIWTISLYAVNPNTTAYFHKNRISNIDSNIGSYDVYLSISFYVEDSYLASPDSPILGDNEMQQVAAILKDDMEKAFGISNNLSSSPLAITDLSGMGRIITYGCNFSAQVDYAHFIQYFVDHTPTGLADSFSPTRLNNADSWLEWSYSTNWDFTIAYRSSVRSPYGDYNSSFECNAYLLHTQYYPSYFPGSYNLTLSDVLDAPFNVPFTNESAFTSSEINIVIEGGNVTSTTISPYHIPRFLGLDHDYWLLLNATYYDTFVEGSGSVADIQVNFTNWLVIMNFLAPPLTPQQGDIFFDVWVSTNLTGAFGPAMQIMVYDEATFRQRVFDDNAFVTGYTKALDQFTLIDMFANGSYMHRECNCH